MGARSVAERARATARVPTPRHSTPALTMTTKRLQQFLRRHGKGEGRVDEEWGPSRSPLTDFPPSKKCRGEGGMLAVHQRVSVSRRTTAGDHKGLVKIPRIFLALPCSTTLAPTDVDEPAGRAFRY